MPDALHRAGRRADICTHLRFCMVQRLARRPHGPLHMHLNQVHMCGLLSKLPAETAGGWQKALAGREAALTVAQAKFCGNRDMLLFGCAHLARQFAAGLPDIDADAARLCCHGVEPRLPPPVQQ